MSERPVPAYVDTRKVFQQEAEIAGAVPLQCLPRFRQSLAGDAAQVSVALAFTSNDSGQRLITGVVRATVDVICQRCLEPLTIALEDEIRLALVPGESEAAGLEPDLDPWINEDYRLDLAPLVEEQLMLCMPIVSYHADGRCKEALSYRAGPDPETTQDAGEGVEENPFSVLKLLKKSD
ncbi:MAG: DUF177 domain-containing protein [Pseudohongiellaceae bacterium]